MRTIVADVSLTVTLSESVTVEIQENLTPEEVGILLKEAARDELGAKLPGDIIIDLDEIDFEKITQDGKPLEFYDPRHIRVEYDEDFHGGDYDDTGDYAYIPLAWIEFFGHMEGAFEYCTGFKPENIIHYTEDSEEYYTADGEEYEEPFFHWENELISYSPTTYRFSFHNSSRDAIVEAISQEFFYEWEAGVDKHTQYIIGCIGERFSPNPSLSRPLSEIVKLTTSVRKYLVQWKTDLASQTYGPNEEETHDAAEKLLLLVFRYLYPEWVTIDKHS